LFGYSITLAVSAERPGTVLRLLEAARKTVVLYLPGHPQVAQALDNLQAGLSTILKSRQSVRFDVYEDAFFLGNRILLEESLHGSALLDECIAHRVGSIEFSQGVPLLETTRLVETLAAAAGGPSDLGKTLASANLQHIRIGPPRELTRDEQKAADIAPRELYRIGLRTMDGLNYQAVQGAPLNLRNARLLVNSMVKVILHDRHALLGVAALHQHDEDTCHHSVNVSVLSLMLGLRIGLDEAAVTALGTAALLHDIGKMRIPRSLLTKPDPLTATERSILERHTVHGAGMVEHLRGLSQTAMLVALEHHLGYNLSGYPRLQWAKNQHLFSRIVAIGDFFDVSVSARRTQHAPMLPDQTMHAIVTGAGKQFDPTLAKLFLQTLGGYPVGSVVRLSTGEIAVVSRPTEGNPLQPQLKVVRDAQGEAIDPVLIESAHDQRRVLHCVDPLRAGIDLAAYL
jgi:putative nucleotidyltransferase with HDIG domain